MPDPMHSTKEEWVHEDLRNGCMKTCRMGAGA